GDGEKSKQSAEHDAGADEDHVRGVRRPVGVAERPGRSLDLNLRADQAHHVARLDARLRNDRHLFTGPHELFQEDAADELETSQLGQCQPGQRRVRYYDVQRLDGDIEQRWVLHLGSDLAAVLHEHLVARRHGYDVVPANHRARLSFHDLALPTDSKDEDPNSLGPRLELGDGAVDEILVRHTVRADVEAARR